MSDCICGDKEAINKYGFNPECKLHYFYAVTIEDYNKLLAEVEKLKEVISYLPKVPTKPYEKELAKENQTLKQALSVAREALEFYGADRREFNTGTKTRELWVKKMQGDLGFIAEKALKEYRGEK